MLSNRAMSVTIDRKLTGVVNYIVHRYPGQTLTRTKLVKLAFLVDNMAQEELGAKITHTDYINYHYGPYSDDIIETTDRLNGDTLTETVNRAPAGKFYDYRPVGELPNIGISNKEKQILDSILERYGNMDTEDLVWEVYDRFDMEEKQKYSTLI